MVQPVLAGLIVALAVVYLAYKVFGVGRRRPRRPPGPDVPVSRLTRRRPRKRGRGADDDDRRGGGGGRCHGS